MGLLAMIGVSLVVILSCGPQSALPYHQGLQQELTYENRMNESESFTLKSYREDLKTLNKKLRDLEKQKGDQAKMNALAAEMYELRLKIAELEGK